MADEVADEGRGDEDDPTHGGRSAFDDVGRGRIGAHELAEVEPAERLREEGGEHERERECDDPREKECKH